MKIIAIASIIAAVSTTAAFAASGFWTGEYTFSDHYGQYLYQCKDNFVNYYWWTTDITC